MKEIKQRPSENITGNLRLDLTVRVDVSEDVPKPGPEELVCW